MLDNLFWLSLVPTLLGVAFFLNRFFVTAADSIDNNFRLLFCDRGPNPYFILFNEWLVRLSRLLHKLLVDLQRLHETLLDQVAFDKRGRILSETIESLPGWLSVAFPHDFEFDDILVAVSNYPVSNDAVDSEPTAFLRLLGGLGLDECVLIGAEIFLIGKAAAFTTSCDRLTEIFNLLLGDFRAHSLLFDLS